MLIEGGRCSRAREALVIIRVVGGVVAIPPPYLPELPKGMFIRSKNLLSLSNYGFATKGHKYKCVEKSKNVDIDERCMGGNRENAPDQAPKEGEGPGQGLVLQ